MCFQKMKKDIPHNGDVIPIDAEIVDISTDYAILDEHMTRDDETILEQETYDINDISSESGLDAFVLSLLSQDTVIVQPVMC